MKLPLDRRGTHLGEWLLFEPFPCGNNQLLLLMGRLSGLRFRGLRMFLVPDLVARLVPLQPLKEPLLRAVQPGIDLLWWLPLQVTHDRSLPDLLFHTITSSLVTLKVIEQKRVSGNRCDGTKMSVKGNRSDGTSG
jgi:hypothetical protein